MKNVRVNINNSVIKQIIVKTTDQINNNIYSTVRQFSEDKLSGEIINQVTGLVKSVFWHHMWGQIK